MSKTVLRWQKLSRTLTYMKAVAKVKRHRFYHLLLNADSCNRQHNSYSKPYIVHLVAHFSSHIVSQKTHLGIGTPFCWHQVSRMILHSSKCYSINQFGIAILFGSLDRHRKDNRLDPGSTPQEYNSCDTEKLHSVVRYILSDIHMSHWCEMNHCSNSNSVVYCL